MKIGKKTAWTAAAVTAALGATIFAVSRIKPDIRKSTYPFCVRDGAALYLDKYETENWLHRKRPVIVFAFGGGFVTGRRDDPRYVDFFHFLARKGYVVISADYRRGMKNIPPEKAKSSLGFLDVLRSAIRQATEDFTEATAFVLEHADEWGIDPRYVIACGSSAGAIAALQSEYAIANRMPEAACLPKEFNYAGVMSFSGAIFDTKQPIWKRKPCPILMFHGDADKQVPYREAIIPRLGGLWGSVRVAESLKARKSPFYFYTVDNASHEICKTAMTPHFRRPICEFLDKLVRHKKRVYITSQNHESKETDVKKDFNVKDYILNNMR